jgi:hypothetical protein
MGLNTLDGLAIRTESPRSGAGTGRHHFLCQDADGLGDLVSAICEAFQGDIISRLSPDTVNDREAAANVAMGAMAKCIEALRDKPKDKHDRHCVALGRLNLL